MDQQSLQATTYLYQQIDIFPFAGIDIGGTLAKLCISVHKDQTVQFNHISELTITNHPLYNVYFFNFLTAEIDSLITFLRELGIARNINKIHVTGGGSVKFDEKFKQDLKVEIIKVDEFMSLQLGMKFLFQNYPQHSFKYSTKKGYEYIENNQLQYPFLFVNIGSGVSILKFKNEEELERISGTALGGGTFMGLCSLLTGVGDFDQLLKMSEQGDSKKVDLLISDIYDNINTFQSPFQGIKESTLAISMGKLRDNKNVESIQKEDLVQSLLHMIAFNIAQISFLLAQIHKTQYVYFAGNFIRHHSQTMDCIDFAFKLFSKKQPQKIHSLFFKHDGYTGSLGCFYLSQIDFQKNRRNSI